MNALTKAAPSRVLRNLIRRTGDDSILGSREQPTDRFGAPVGPVFVPLYLLEAQAKRMGKLSLVNAQSVASHPYPAADIFIDPV